MKGLVLAGGHGTRLRPLTFTGNKHMIPIANRPMLFYALNHLSNANIKDIGIILGPINEGVKDLIGDGASFDLSVTYIDQPVPKGLAHAVLISEDFLDGEPFVMYLGDNLLKQGVTPLVNSYHNGSGDCVICVSPVQDPRQFGIVELDSKGNLAKLVEKPSTPKSNLALVGVYLFNNYIFEAVKNIKPSWRNELEITDAIQYLHENGKKVSIQHVEGWWKDTGKPDDLLEANQLILDDIVAHNDGFVEPSSQLVGKVSIGKNTVIKSNTRIKGPVIIGEECEIGPNVYIGPYTSIGDDTRVLSGEVEGSIIMQGVLLNCKKRIVDSIIGRQSSLESSESLPVSGLRFVIGDRAACRL
jgi:glucose-1-phosphate thymidylyltransferase